MTAVLKLLSGRPRVLGLGEPTHGEDVLLHVRNELFQSLVDEGYRTIAIESDCLMGLVVDEYVTTGRGSLDEVMRRGFSHGWGASAANRELVSWMRAYNEGRSASDWVRFAGFDGPLELAAAASPGPALIALHSALAARVDADLLPCDAETLDSLLGSDELWTNPAAMMDPGASVGQAAPELRGVADDLVALLSEQTPAFASDDLVHLYARTAVGLLRYHFWMADSSPGRLARLAGVRDAMMAANLLALAARGPVFVHAHNSHLQRGRSGMRLGGQAISWWGAGAIVDARLGGDYAFVATAIGTIRQHGVSSPPPDTIEGQLYGLPEDRSVVSPQGLAGVPRVSPWFGYAPLDPTQLARIDGIVFVKDL
ncbi:Erythromycin esterase homolog [Asanoa ishikariensis]|uniref:Erythromycin esterase homolog n=1 Tax=Asanoa ishikariensis TaxID=137265 RepID=A0A1H3T7Y3_9ACTN|nr:erythromycin esterase family protein [Asanoa ishikariensis]SDZ45961.1 Erythromycin esterase homolog [Asanoa ishikariensis]